MLGEWLALGLAESVALGVPPVPQAVVDTLQEREGGGEEEMLGEGVALVDWLREPPTLAERWGVTEGLPLAGTVGVGSAVREDELVTV